MLKITFYGHSCFGLEDGTTKLITDPYLTGNDLAAVSPREVEADYILVSHGHGDHVGDTAAIAKRTGASIISPVDVSRELFGNKFPIVPGNIGGKTDLPFGSVKLVPAIHGSGVAGALACGFVIRIGGKTVYHMGDTSLTRDFELLAGEIDVLLVPIGDVYTMGPEDALRAVKMIRPGLTIPMHYNTFPVIRQDPEAFAASVGATGFEAKVLAPGQGLTL